MVSIPKVVGVLSCGLLLCLGLSGNAASAADEMKAGQSPRQGGQAGVKGEEDKLKGDEMKAGQSPRQGGQAGVKGEEDKLKGDEMKAGQSPRQGGQAGVKGEEDKLKETK
jgi:hypothetical protein